MGAQPGQFGQPGGMAPQQAGMQAQGMGAPGEAARSVSRISGMGSQIFNMQHAGRTLLRCSDMLQSACHPCKLCRQQTVAAGQTCARPSHNRATNRQHHEQNISQNLPAGAGGNVQMLQSKLQQIIQMNQLQGFFPPGSQQFNKALQSVSRVDFR